MNKLGLREEVYHAVKQKAPKLTKIQIKEILDIIIDLMSESLVNTKRLSLRDFGILEVAYLKDRKGFNPMSRQAITIPGRTRIKFKPSQKLLKKINER